MAGIYIDSFDFQYLKKCTLGERLRFFRQKMIQYHGSENYTTTALGERLNVTPQTISAIERGVSKNPSFLVINELTEEYRVPLKSVTDKFYEGDEELFTIGIPNVIETDLDFDDFDELYINGTKIDLTHEDIGDTEDSLESLTSIFDIESRTGILFYEIHAKDIIRPLYHQHVNSNLNHSDTVELLSRLIFDTEKYSVRNKQASEIHPEVQALELLSNANKTLDSIELIDFMLKRQGDDN
ncbi:helix-turn-helix domain-containing protein [Psychrobacillus psychrodurans]|uniref:helix-turn-helix domain-containing protein n=1 Tax=Psychrobacillus psychrodurans TaxID=126157 RepID=UPI0008ED7056|nr:helix-turn-helix transcriptional regulator [Psychrobacillus psychrodurans]MCZ8540278.1 helix-turn-helix transcriptional regulator [Psychrobacillus psychrodurans]SFM61478.1 DNA-binding transcriptional regulator, XRE-family HTH domain [Psychrobacillus psychrodurans]